MGVGALVWALMGSRGGLSWGLSWALVGSGRLSWWALVRALVGSHGRLSWALVGALMDSRDGLSWAVVGAPSGAPSGAPAGPRRESEQEQQDKGPLQALGPQDNSRTASHARTTRTRNTTSRFGGSSKEALIPPTSDNEGASREC